MKERIYGVSSKFEFNQWNHIIHIFENKEDADEWLHTEQSDFRERELMSRTEAIELVGIETVEDAELFYEMN